MGGVWWDDVLESGNTSAMPSSAAQAWAPALIIALVSNGRDRSLAAHIEIQRPDDKAHLMRLVMCAIRHRRVPRGEGHMGPQRRGGKLAGAIAVRRHDRLGVVFIALDHQSLGASDMQEPQHVAGRDRSEQHLLGSGPLAIASKGRVGGARKRRFAFKLDHMIAGIAVKPRRAAALIPGPAYRRPVSMRFGYFIPPEVSPAFPIWLASGEAIAAERDLQVISD